MLVKVLVSEEDSYNEIAFKFPSITSAGAFIECLAMSSVKKLVFEVTYEEEAHEEESRFKNPEEGEFEL